MMLISLIQSVQAEDRIITGDLQSLEFLDYLGQLVETDGELVGPADFEDETEIPAEPERDEWISRDRQEVYRD